MVDRSVDETTKVHLVNMYSWRGYNNPWMPLRTLTTAYFAGSGSPSRLEAESEVDRSVDASTKVHLVNIHGWRGYNNPWMAEEETDSEYSYINLLANPERYTGYKVAISIA